MDMCMFPGCIAAATKDGRCWAHWLGVGKQCEACKGSGFLLRAGEGASHKRSTCDRCGGVGLRDYRKPAQRVKPNDDPIDKRGLIELARDDVA